MKQNKRDFLEAIGFEDPEETKKMLMQLGVGIVIGFALIVCLGLAECSARWIGGQ